MNPVSSALVSVKGLDVPSEAREEFAEACDAVRGKNLSAAQKALSRAVKAYPKFAAAWVLLGQIQGDQGKAQQAQQSCSQGRDADANYLPSYLCLADLAAHEEKWGDVADLTNRVLGMHPVRAPGAYYYNSLAYFYLKQVPLAEKSALRAAEDSETDKKPQVHWLLAKIYELKGDRAAEANQLRTYLKLAPHASDSEMARRILREIETQASKLPVENK